MNQTIELLTTRQVADRFDRTIQTIGNWCRTGRLPAQKMGRDWMIPADAVDLFTPPPTTRPRNLQNNIANN